MTVGPKEADYPSKLTRHTQCDVGNEAMPSTEPLASFYGIQLRTSDTSCQSFSDGKQVEEGNTALEYNLKGSNQGNIYSVTIAHYI